MTVPELISGDQAAWCIEPRCLNTLQKHPTKPEWVACAALSGLRDPRFRVGNVPLRYRQLDVIDCDSGPIV